MRAIRNVGRFCAFFKATAVVALVGGPMGAAVADEEVTLSHKLLNRTTSAFGAAVSGSCGSGLIVGTSSAIRYSLPPIAAVYRTRDRRETEKPDN